MMSSRPASLAVKAFGMPRAGRPEKARVITVRSWRAARIACLCAAGAPDSGHVRNAVPSCAAAAPRVSAAVIARPSMIPPEAITGTRTAAAIPATRSSIGTIATSKRAGLGALRDDRIDAGFGQHASFAHGGGGAEDGGAPRPDARHRILAGYAEGEAEAGRTRGEHCFELRVGRIG